MSEGRTYVVDEPKPRPRRRLRRLVGSVVWVALAAAGGVLATDGWRNYHREPEPAEPQPTREELHQCEEDEAQFIVPRGLACLPVSATNIDEVLGGARAAQEGQPASPGF